VNDLRKPNPCRILDLSVVIPVFNEHGNLADLHDRLTTAIRPLAACYELIFVDDGSTDGSREKLLELHEKDEAVRVLYFTRNFGHHIALTAGLDAADGDRVVIMDSDLQDPPEAIASLWTKMDEGWDVVVAVRQNRKDGFFKRSASRVFLALINRVAHSRIQLTSGVFRMMSRRVVNELRLLREEHRFVLGLISWLGFRETGVPVEHGARHRGKTTYDFWKMVTLALNTMTAFSQTPLRIASLAGLGISALSFGAGLAIVVRKVLWGIPVQGWASLFVTATFMGGMQLVMLGIIGEYIGRLYSQSLRRPLYVVDRELRRSEK
jgi:glycosyltransferase involved in cell wall biosynthesis